MKDLTDDSSRSMFQSNPNVNVGINILRAMTSELAKLCGFANPLKCTNHGSKALAINCPCTSQN